MRSSTCATGSMSADRLRKPCSMRRASTCRTSTPATASCATKTSPEARRSSYSALISRVGQSPVEIGECRHRIPVGVAERTAEVVAVQRRCTPGGNRSRRGTSLEQGSSAGDGGGGRCERSGRPGPARWQPTVLVAQPEDGAGRQIAASTRTADADPAGRRCRGRRLVTDPADRGDDVVERDRVGHAVDGEPVVHADHDSASAGRHLPRRPVGLAAYRGRPT